MATILVVDDSAVDCRLVSGLLERSGKFQVEVARDGLEAIEWIKQRLPQAVVTDILMPNMDGFELVAYLACNYPMVPVILMTAKGNEETAVRALQAGAASYVPKQMLADMLVETLDRVLHVAREEDTYRRLMSSMTSSLQSFHLGNDASIIPPLIQYLHSTLRAVGVCDEAACIRVCVALEEALNNALFHGNLEISSESRDGNLVAYRRLIEQRRTQPPYQDRRILVEAQVTRGFARFTIRDEGPGFDPRSLPDPTDAANLDKVSGRGLLLMRTFMDEVAFNPTGNEVTLIKRSKTVSP